MKLQLTKPKTANTVGLEIEADSVAAVEVRANGSVEIGASAVEPLAAGAISEGEVVDGEALGESLKALFSQHKLPRRVRLGVGNQRVVVRTIRLPAIEDPKELDAAVRFQAQDQIPMPLDQAVVEHQVVGGVPGEDGSSPQIDVTVVAARRDMIASFLEPVRSAGLEPVGIDLSAFGMIRALAGVSAATDLGPEAAEGASPAATDVVLYCSLGDVTNLAVARGRACLFTRVSASGLEQMTGTLASTRALSAEHAAQWMAHVGLEHEVEAVEGDPEIVSETRRVLEEGVSTVANELRLSLDYYGAQEGAEPIGRIVLCGPGSAIPGFAQQLESVIGLPVAGQCPPALSGLEPLDAARLTLPFGLALEA